MITGRLLMESTDLIVKTVGKTESFLDVKVGKNPQKKQHQLNRSKCNYKIN